MFKLGGVASVTRPPWPLLPHGLLGLVTIPLGIMSVVVYCRLFPPILFGDAGFYKSALPALIGNQPLYDPAFFAPHVAPGPPFWDQAPPTAMLSLPLLLPGGTLIWGLLLVACTVAAVAILMPRLGGGIVLFAPVVVALPPVIEAMAWGNLSALVFLLFAIAWRWPKHAGWAIGLATAAKLLPAVTIAWLVGRRDWRGVAVALAIPAALTLATMALTSPGVVIDFLRVRLSQSYPRGRDAWPCVYRRSAWPRGSGGYCWPSWQPEDRASPWRWWEHWSQRRRFTCTTSPGCWSQHWAGPHGQAAAWIFRAGRVVLSG